MELINSILHFLTDKTKKLPHKVILCLVALIFIVVIDNFLSFTFSYNNSNKIEQIQGINKILSDTTLTKYEKEKLLTLRQNIVNHNTWKDKAYNFLNNFKFNEKIEGEKKITIPEIKTDDKTKAIERDYYWHFVSSSWIFIFLMVILPFIMFFDKQSSFWQVVGIIIIVEPILYCICWLYGKVFSYIPVIDENPLYNYILNALLCFASLFVFQLFNKKK